jgi:hypothetical protein
MCKHHSSLPTSCGCTVQNDHNGDPIFNLCEVHLQLVNSQLTLHNSVYLLPPTDLTRFGIEPNPGPPKNKTVVKEVVVRNPPKKKKSKGRARNRVKPRSRGPLDVYRETLLNPFFAPVPRLGIGTMVPTSIMCPFLRGQLTIGVTATCFAVMTQPCPTGILQFNTNTNPNLVTDIQNTGTILDASNRAQVIAMAQSARIISGALRVTVRYAPTTLPGSIFLVSVNADSATNVGLTTYNQLAALRCAERCVANTDNTVQGEVSFRPYDTTSFEFYTNYVSNSRYPVGATSSALLVVGTGWSANQFQVDYDVIWNFETMSGIDGAGDDVASLADVADGVTAESLLRAGPSELPYRLSSNAIAALDQASQTITASSRRTGFGPAPPRGYRSHMSIQSAGPAYGGFHTDYVRV